MRTRTVSLTLLTSIITTTLMSGCQSTQITHSAENTEAVESTISFESKGKILNSNTNKILFSPPAVGNDKVKISSVSADELTHKLPASISSPASSSSLTSAQILSLRKEQPIDAALTVEQLKYLNQQVCKNNVTVNYQVPNASGTLQTYQAIVQLQAKVMAFNNDGSLTRFKLTNWHTRNDNLQRWRPYLKKTPQTANISLQPAAQSWDNLSGWFICKITS